MRRRAHGGGSDRSHGHGYQGPAVDEPSPGFTRCEWQGSDSNFGFTFASLKAIEADGTTAAKAFDIDLQAVENDTRKRELLPGIAVNAATVDLGDGAALLEVQREDGVARMIVYKVAREKMLALAKAIAQRPDGSLPCRPGLPRTTYERFDLIGRHRTGGARHLGAAVVDRECRDRSDAQSR